jgi:hypothetical protein
MMKEEFAPQRHRGHRENHEKRGRELRQKQRLE